MGFFRRSKPNPLNATEKAALTAAIDRISSTILSEGQGSSPSEWVNCITNGPGWSIELRSAARAALKSLPDVTPEEAIKRTLCFLAFVEENYAKTGKGQQLTEAPLSETGKTAQDIFHEFSALLQRLYVTPSRY